MLYTYFQSKEDIFKELVNDRTDRFLTQLRLRKGCNFKRTPNELFHFETNMLQVTTKYFRLFAIVHALFKLA